jgi:LacI family transcriptional regulator
MHATLFDVCKKARVSTATVSRVLNDSPLVSHQTRSRVEKAIRQLGYHPSHAAQTLARQRTQTIGAIFPDIASGFFAEVLSGIDGIAAEHEFHLMTAFSHGHRDEKELIVRTLRERRVDALILMNLSLPDNFTKAAAKFGIPIVLIDRPVVGANLFAVSMDNSGGAEAAMSHLIEHGYRRIAVLSGPSDNYDAVQRLAGCEQALERAGLSVPQELLWRGTFTEASGNAAMERWLNKGQPLPEVIFAANDAMALGVWNVLRERGYDVPRDVALVGFDDTEAARHLGLTSVRVPMREMGRAAAEAAVTQILSGEAQKQRVLATNLVVRRSCGCSSVINQ